MYSKERVRLAIDKRWNWSEEEETRKTWNTEMEGYMLRGTQRKGSLWWKGILFPVLEVNTNSPDIQHYLSAINYFLNYFWNTSACKSWSTKTISSYSYICVVRLHMVVDLKVLNCSVTIKLNILNDKKLQLFLASFFLFPFL